MARPAAGAMSALATRKIAGPMPASASRPLTSVTVSVATATESCATPLTMAIDADSRNVLRRIGRRSIGVEAGSKRLPRVWATGAAGTITLSEGHGRRKLHKGAFARGTLRYEVVT